jgi:hypothetical protein
MSLNKFLAAGRSFAGIRDEKSPYEMRREVQLPHFEPSARFTKPPNPPPMVQTDWLDTSGPKRPIPAAPLTQSTVGERVENPRRNWLRFFRFGRFGRTKKKIELVQAEMKLEKVRVLRNDLADADLEVVVKKQKSSPPAQSQQETNAIAHQRSWSELTARLFELSQR